MGIIKVGVIGNGIEVSQICELLFLLPEVEVVAVAGDNVHLPPEILPQCRCYTFNQAENLISLPNIDMIITFESLSEAVKDKLKKLNPGIEILGHNAIEMLLRICRDREHFKKLKGELSAILNAMQEAIEVADSSGKIKYVNPAFTRVTGIEEAARIGKNIFEVSPNGALAQSLRVKQAIINHRTKVGGSEVEVISNASPIINNGQLDGAVVVFQPVNDLLKLLEELKKSSSIIENLNAKIDQISTSKYKMADFIGQSDVIKEILFLARKAATADFPVLICGETGTGKEILSHAIHQESERRDKPFVKINCAAIPGSLLEDEFFGQEKKPNSCGPKLGKVELAHGGTLFLDEIGDMDLNFQAKLLRVLQEKEFVRLGGDQTIIADVRVIATTNRDIKALIKQGLFREDLYYRLNIIELTLPPLRKRKEDIPLIIAYQLNRLNRKLGKNVRELSPEAMEVLLEYDWPGNVRELENVLERAIVTSETDVLSDKIISQIIGPIDRQSFEVNQFQFLSLEKMEEIMIKTALSKYGYNLSGKKSAAQALNISLATLYNKLRKYQDISGMPMTSRNKQLSSS